jgi:oligosaccharide repeat unit polymerase
MSLLLIIIASFSGIVFGRIFFKKWFNHLTLYSIIMGGLFFFYELKLLPYPNIIPLAWFMIVGSFLAFILGVVTFFAARNLYPNNKLEGDLEISELKIFNDGGRALKYSVLFFSLIGLFVALHRWYILIGKFGSIQDVVINAAVVYRLNIQGEIKEFIPFLPSFIYVGVFLSGIYTAYNKKFTFLSVFPIITIILKELTYFGRGEILFASMEFVFTFLLFRHFLVKTKKDSFKFSRINAFVTTVILLVLIMTVSSFIRISRGSRENYVGTDRQLKQMKDNFLFSPSIYLYISSDAGVLSKYLEMDKEETKIGENSFRLFYDFLSRFNLVEKPKFFQRGYFIPMWTNTGTFIREIHADFGIIGVLVIPFSLGLILTWLWFNFLRTGNIYTILFMVYLYLIIGFSFLVMVTRLNQWYFSQILILMYLPILQKLASSKNSYKLVVQN